MNVIFLCAGYGTRLYPLTKRTPKPLLPIAGDALMTYLLRKLERVPSIEKVVVLSNGRFYDHFCRWLKSFDFHRSISLINDGTKNPEHRLGAVQDLKLALDQAGTDTDYLVLAGDNLFDAGLDPFVSFAQSKDSAAAVGVYDVLDRQLAKKYGLIKADASGKITDFFEKPNEPSTTLASMGIYYFSKRSLRFIPEYLETNRNPDAPGYYISWLAGKIDVYAFRFSGAWFDIGDLDSYKKAQDYVQSKKKKVRL